jgi:hypothetical protein
MKHSRATRIVCAYTRIIIRRRESGEEIPFFVSERNKKLFKASLRTSEKKNEIYECKIKFFLFAFLISSRTRYPTPLLSSIQSNVSQGFVRK